MTEEIKDGAKKYPDLVVAPIIYNDQGEILMVQLPKWGDYWVFPGGHIEYGETAEQALKREILEETGLKIDNIEFINWQEKVNPEGFYKKIHFVAFNYCARLAGGELTKSDEMENYIWMKPQEALKTLKIPPTMIKSIELYLKHLENKKNGYEDKYKRALADYQNLLKQTAKEKMEFAVFANEQMLKEILPVYDHLKMSLGFHNGESTDEWLAGVKHIVKQFKDVLNKIGVEEIEAKGGRFDHNLMDAVGSEETADENLDGQVARQIKAGYKLNGKVIEAAKVVVYKKK